MRYPWWVRVRPLRDARNMMFIRLKEGKNVGIQEVVRALADYSNMGRGQIVDVPREDLIRVDKWIKLRGKAMRQEDICNVAASLAVLRHKSVWGLHTARDLIEKHTIQTLIRLLTGLACLGEKGPFAKLLASHSQHLIAEKHQRPSLNELSDLLWASSWLNVNTPPLVRSIEPPLTALVLESEYGTLKQLSTKFPLYACFLQLHDTFPQLPRILPGIISSAVVYLDQAACFTTLPHGMVAARFYEAFKLRSANKSLSLRSPKGLERWVTDARKISASVAIKILKRCTTHLALRQLIPKVVGKIEQQNLGRVRQALLTERDVVIAVLKREAEVGWKMSKDDLLAIRSAIGPILNDLGPLEAISLFTSLSSLRVRNEHLTTFMINTLDPKTTSPEMFVRVLSACTAIGKPVPDLVEYLLQPAVQNQLSPDMLMLLMENLKMGVHRRIEEEFVNDRSLR
eukprot:TRINITY_DN6745_c0_g1_i1.p1 TRINITY_DN6745_c0_g1~~TRINITY_DN6745_c0_g1_i1.p1  ORF type:complete len:456 (+),score=66.07 TRINITY_DN6745_c0_g1_i1:120-1487(+)